ncbi:MAG: extracellular solute-binding protein, partial [Phycisphaerae bacterium]|nr:extracellular solute-binding protein [Phycisphaerae bacterium]
MEEQLQRFFAGLRATLVSIPVLVLLALGLAYLLYPHSELNSQAEQVTELVMWMPLQPVLFDPMKPVIREFERRNPQYSVRLGAAATRDDTADPTRFLLGVAGGQPPDVMYFDRFAIVEWASRGAFSDLTPYIERDRDKPYGIRREDYFEVAWNEPIYKGANYAIANEIDTRALFYSFDPLIRAGFVYTADDPDVLAGNAKVGDARPPKTWEELCRKILHANGNAGADGRVVLEDLTRRQAVNEDVPDGAAVDLGKTGARVGDVVALVSGVHVFRGRIRQVVSANTFTIDFDRDQPHGLSNIPQQLQGRCEVKIFDQDCYQARLTRFDPETGQLAAIGFIPFFGNSWLYMYGWLNGASFMSPDGTRCTLDSPEIVEALQWLTDTHDIVGGARAATAFQMSMQTLGLGPALDPFLTGRLAMRIDLNGFIDRIVAFKPDHRFGVVPAPIPEKRLATGFGSMGWGGGWAFAIPATAQHQDGAWELIKWLSSPDAVRIRYEYHAMINRSQGQAFFPFLHPDKRCLEWARATYVDGNPSLSPYVVQAFDGMIKLLPNSKYRPVTPVGQKLWNEHVRAAEAAINHTKTPYDALNYGQRRVQSALNGVFNPPTGPLINWPLLIGLYVGVVIVVFVALAIVQERRRRALGLQRRGWLEGYIAASPWLIGFIVFGAGPILFSAVISLCHYEVLTPARFIGFDNYIGLFGSHYDDVVE